MRNIFTDFGGRKRCYACQMRAFVFLLSMALLAQVATPQTPKLAAGGGPVTDDDKTIYAIGLSIFRSLTPFDLSPAELQLIKKALDDSAAGKPAVELDQ